MNIRNPRELKSFAAQRLMYSQSERRIVLLYAGISVGLAALVTVVNYVLGLQIDNFGGLGNIGKRTILSTVQTVLPMVQSLVLLCLDVGYLAAMLRVARGQYTSPQTLRLGFDRLWVLLRCSVVKGILYFATISLGVYLGVMLYMVSPFSDRAMELLMPYITDVSVLNSQIIVEDAVYVQLNEAMIPAYIICGVICCALMAPVVYSYRMVNFVIIDRPAMGAMAALRESKKMMRGNRMALFKLDVSLWWYFGVTLLASVVCYGDVILPLLGVSLPWHGDVSYFLFFVLYLALTFVICYFLRNRVEVTYSLAYDTVKPEEKQNGGVVLGNIFDM